MSVSSGTSGEEHQQRVREIAADISALGRDLLQVGRVSSAAVQFEKALGLVRDDIDAALGLGHCLHHLGKFEDALVLYDRLVEVSPSCAAGWNNRGTTLLEMCRYADAAASFTRALEIAASLHDARVALASCQQALGLVDEAMHSCDMVLAAAPEHAEAHWNRSLLLLLKGQYREGWREYEWRWQKRGFTSPQRDFVQPRWYGEPAAGKTILIHAEQGFGDTLQFCRYLPLVAAQGLLVVFECHPPLVQLMRSLESNLQVVAMGQPLPAFDLHLPLMSLPLIFDTIVETVPAAVPYLAPVNQPCDRRQFGDSAKLNIGLCWAGKGYPDPLRSCPLELLEPLAGLPDLAWYSLQVGWQGNMPLPMTDFTEQFSDFADTADVIAQLDLVITIDTAVAHLAGALGRPTWVMLPHAPDWRWMQEREDSPWYPTMRVFRQKAPGDWSGTISAVERSLRKLQR